MSSEYQNPEAIAIEVPAKKRIHFELHPLSAGQTQAIAAFF